METKNTGVVIHPSLQLLYSQRSTLESLMRLNLNSSINAADVVLQELEYLQMQVQNNPKLLECTQDSIVLSVKSAIRRNLTLDPEAGLVYCKTRKVKTSPTTSVMVLDAKPTCNGDLSIAYDCGTILDHDRPEVIFNDAGKVVEVVFKYQLASGRWTEQRLKQIDFDRLAMFSHKENGRYQNDSATVNYANKLYYSWRGGIDPEFARAKALKHSLKKLGTNINNMYRSNKVKLANASVIDAKVANEEVREDEIQEETTTHTDVTNTQEAQPQQEEVINVIVHDAVVIDPANIPNLEV